MSTKLGTEGESQKPFYWKKNERKRGGEKEKIKTEVCSVCAYFWLHSQAVDTATSVCASASTLPAPQHVCPMKGEQLSCLCFSQKKKNQPWCHHEPILNLPLSKSITPALPLSNSFSVPPLPPSHSCLSDSSLDSPLFHISVFFNIPFSHPCLLSLSPHSCSETTQLFFLSFFLSWQVSSNWITKKCIRSPKLPWCSDYHKLCLSCGFYKENALSAWGQAKKIKAEKNEE